MPTRSQLPIACALGAGAMKTRSHEWTTLARTSLVGRQLHARGVVLRYRRDPATEAELRRLVALENDCCAFLAFELIVQERELALTITGPEQAILLIREYWSESLQTGT
jgi:hypothetical protein